MFVARATSETREPWGPASVTASIDMPPTSRADTATPEARRPAMSPVDCHEMGMLSSVMRALKHMEAYALYGQRPSWRSSVAGLWKHLRRRPRTVAADGAKRSALSADAP